LTEASAKDYGPQIIEALNAQGHDLTECYESGAIKLHRGALEPGFTSLLAIDADCHVVINAQIKYRFLTGDDLLAVIQKERVEGRGNFFHILRVLRAIHGGLSDAKAKAMGLREVYGHEVIQRPYMGDMMWMRRDMCLPFHYFTMQHILAQQIQPNLDVIFEIGCGIGDMLAELAASTPYPHIDFYGGDIYENSRRGVREFSEILNLPTLHGVDFDITKPDFSFLKGKKRALVYSQFTLVYVTPFPDTFFSQLLDVVDEVTVVLFEPISFELADEAPNLKPLFSRKRARAYSICENLWSCIRSLERGGRIVIEDVVPDMIGKTSLNSVSLVRFRKK
jgi:SAM-dependent methyltransferase